VDTRQTAWSGPSWWERSQTGWASFYPNLSYDWSNNLGYNFLRRSNDWSWDWDWNSSKSGNFSISLSFDPLESVVFHDEEGDLGHGLSQDVLTGDVGAVVQGDGRCWAWHDLFFLDHLDDFFWHVVNLRGAGNDFPSTAEVQSV
jgi:hypothetical protein